MRIIMDFYLLVSKKVKGRLATNNFTEVKISFRNYNLNSAANF